MTTASCSPAWCVGRGPLWVRRVGTGFAPPDERQRCPGRSVATREFPDDVGAEEEGGDEDGDHGVTFSHLSRPPTEGGRAIPAALARSHSDPSGGDI